MLNNLLKVSTELQGQGYPKFPSIGEAALYALLGFITVFVGIAFLIFIVWAVGKLMTFVDNKAAKPKKAKKTEQAVPAETSTNSTAEADIDEETVAVITAAIMAYYVKENKKCEFTVKRIKRL